MSRPVLVHDERALARDLLIAALRRYIATNGCPLYVRAAAQAWLKWQK